MGSSVQKTTFYFSKFRVFLKSYNRYHGTLYSTELTHSNYMQHIKQEDSYNCGPLIVYFFEQICNQESLTTSIDMGDYRKRLKYLLISKAPNMKEMCLFCSRKYTLCDYEQCFTCKRYLHDRCATLPQQSHTCIVENMCELCKMY